ncbi:M1 family metallopeptidase [Trinickia caryophylli]|uniref:Aminopeptidase n=1 Tax=Trinickia caryophylli TaxID=28094 RepID=A0A1X7DDC5_TRICW|nr:M1 family metallopeptidase [Trinickia caryophylli]PMS09768.1 peptidase M1 [Trinickia caryophylli]TRX16830.1 peptidase M1 [Trinickia caryophylli]WQE12441.1 M1 family metallopeptidase [Trinickia caryophylli]SMF13300.1 aminopeptidase N [Trinickia caryophylli]GLU31410.1 peptidase [Trinickia caryophylli]
MRSHFGWKIGCISIAALLALAGCGGGDGSQTAVSRASGGTSSAQPSAIVPATTVAATPGVDKTVSPVEMPDTVMPVNYRLWFRPNADLSAFDGRADVEIKVLKPVTSIVVAAHRLQFVNGTIALQPGNVPLIATPQDDGDYYQLRPASGLIAAGTYSLHMEWRGIINFKSYDDPVTKTGGSCGNDPYPGCSAAEGIFRVDLKSTDGTTSGAILTQAESDLARQWFPGWDEPAFRPTYEVSADVPQAWRVVSNAAERPSVNVDSGYKRVSFEKTPPMPSYLLFFGGGKFDVLEDDFASPLPDGKGLHLRVFTPPGMRDWAKPAMEQTKQALDYYYRYTGIPLPLTKFDTVAANDAFKEEKDLNFGGMENWGAILEFADDILPQPGSPMSNYGVTVITHEVAHQWFGDLVTLDWWDDVWLNESFATFFENKTKIRFFPDRFSWESEVKNKYRVIAADLKSTSFPVQPNFNAWASNDFVIDAGTFVYDKGGQVLKMIEGYLGDEVMRSGLQQYLADYALGNVTPKRLWDELSRASGQSMTAIGDSFVRQTGVPLISLNTLCDLTTNQTVVTLKQQPFPNQNRYPGTQWTIPLTLAYGDNLASRSMFAMKGTDMQVRLPGCGAVLADPTGQDYYVVNYGDNAWTQLLSQASALQDPARLTNLKLGTHLLVDNGLADQSRATAIDSINVAPSVALRMLRLDTSALEPVVRRPMHYQGRLKAKRESK